MLSLSLTEPGPTVAKHHLAVVSGLMMESNVVVGIPVTLLELLMPQCACVCVCARSRVELFQM